MLILGTQLSLTWWSLTRSTTRCRFFMKKSKMWTFRWRLFLISAPSWIFTSARRESLWWPPTIGRCTRPTARWRTEESTRPRRLKPKTRFFWLPTQIWRRPSIWQAWQNWITVSSGIAYSLSAKSFQSCFLFLHCLVVRRRYLVIAICNEYWILTAH